MSRPLTVLASSSVPEGIRGALTQWFSELLPGVFVGTPTKRVRDLLWESLSSALVLGDGGYAALIELAPTEQGYLVRTAGNHPYQVEDFDGLQLVTRRHQPAPAGLFEDLPDPSW